MTFDSYIAEVKAGKFKIVGGGRAHGDLIEGFVMLNPKDVDAVTAEAFNQQVFSAEEDWQKARAQVERSLKT
jgi:hypothetical protein